MNSLQQLTLQLIIDIFERFMMQPTIIDQFDKVGREVLREKLSFFVILNRPIDFVMLGFPFKSTNIRDKVIGTLPDMAELKTLENFTRFNSQIKEVYPPGVHIHIVSDGFIFNDLLNVPDQTVVSYKHLSMDFGMSSNAPMLWYDLNDFYKGNDLREKREKVVNDFGITAEKLETDILMNPDVNYLYRGMIIFMEEELAMQTFPSKNQHTKAAKSLARQMMFRNEAYSNLVRQEFSSMIRLSMHPSINNGAKYSFQLIPSENARHSAWHSVLVVDEKGELSTVHRKDAEAAGHQLIYQDNRPFYFLKAA
jgi:pyoverdine/dityrosine biosynthesis protein Dit1